MKALWFISHFLEKFIIWFFAVIIGCIIVANIVSFFMNSVAMGLAIVFVIFLLCAIGLLLYKTRVYKKKSFWIALFILGIVARLLYAVFNQIELVSDSLLCYNSAVAVTQGDLSWLDMQYFKVWTYQIPFVYYEALLLTIFKTVRALYIFDALWGIVMCFLIYKITERITNNKLIALVLSCFYVWLPSSFLNIGVLYNLSISGAILLFGVYLFIVTIDKIKNNKRIRLSGWLLSLSAGAVISLSCLFRQEGAVVFLACICYYFYLCFCFRSENEHDLKKQYMLHILNSVISLVGLIAGYMIVSGLVDYLFAAAGITDAGIGNNCPYWHIVCGLTPENYGQYSEKYVWICDILDKEEQKKAFSQIINDIFSGRSFFDVLWFFVMKFYYMWGAPNAGFGIPSSSLIEKGFSVLYLALDKLIYLGCLVLSLIGIKFRNTAKRDEHIFLAIAFIGFFLAYFIKEAGARYRYDPMLVLVLISAFGMMAINEKKRLFD